MEEEESGMQASGMQKYSDCEIAHALVGIQEPINEAAMAVEMIKITQGLKEILDDKDRQIETLKAKIERMEAYMNAYLSVLPLRDMGNNIQYN